MTDRIDRRNGFVSEPHQEKAWYRLSPGAWGLLAVLLVLNVFNLLIPGFLDPVFRNLDIRLWPGWYFMLLAAALAFSLLWYLGTSCPGEENCPGEMNAKERDTPTGKVVEP